MQLLYFGWVRARVGIGQEVVHLPTHIKDVSALIEWLKKRGDRYHEAFENLSLIRVAITQEITTLDARVDPDDEVALFPPMTGG